MAQRRELIKGSIASLLLCLIAQQPMYGYRIIKELERKSQGYFKFKEGTLYPALHRLEHRGWIKAEWGVSELGRRARFYSLTAAGRKQLEVETENWGRLSAAIARVLRMA